MYSKDIPERFQKPKEDSVTETILLTLCDLLKRLRDERPLREVYSKYHGCDIMVLDKGGEEFDGMVDDMEQLLQDIKGMDDREFDIWKNENSRYNPYADKD